MQAGEKIEKKKKQRNKTPIDTRDFQMPCLLALPVPTPMHRQWSFAKLRSLRKYHSPSAASPGQGEYTPGSRRFVVPSLFYCLIHALSAHLHAGEDPPAEQVYVELVNAIHGTDNSVMV